MVRDLFSMFHAFVAEEKSHLVFLHDYDIFIVRLWSEMESLVIHCGEKWKGLVIY